MNWFKFDVYICLRRSDVNDLRGAVEGKSSTLDSHDHTLQEIEGRLADMEDRNRRCNVRVVGVKEGLEGSNAIQYLSRSLPKWFPSLAGVQIEIMRVHRIYSDGPRRNTTTSRTLIFNVLRHTTRQLILQAAWKSTPVVEGRKIRFSPDYSNYTVKRRQAFYPAMDSARVRGLDFFLLYPATLKIRDGPQYRAFTSAGEAEEYINRAAPLPLVAARRADASVPATEDAGEGDQD
ncbi:hypothetical protein DPEC_G00373910 [Dallia pectoralis]|nr:hypothetical protein DPEC_G00373910 [Dallia pectoralis]